MLNSSHISVMVNEIIEKINPFDSGVYVDGTFGAGGVSQALLEKANCKVFAFDRDPEAIVKGKKYFNNYGNRINLFCEKFSNLDKVLEKLGQNTVNGIALDLGVSSTQIDSQERGFSFTKDGPLDMRMSKKGKTAADLVNNLSEIELADIIWTYGEERFSFKIAKAIIKARQVKKITTTHELSSIIVSAIRNKNFKIHPATRTFQALRIEVNKELEELEKVLKISEKILAPNSSLVVISFHSLEDRIVKNFFIDRSGKGPKANRYLPENINHTQPTFLLLDRVLRPTEKELNNNPRARSAKLRTAIRNEVKFINRKNLI